MRGGDCRAYSLERLTLRRCGATSSYKLDEAIGGHVFCSFLALVLKAELEDRIAGPERSSKHTRRGLWPEIFAGLNSLTEVEQDGKRFFVRSDRRPAASLALRAAGVALPPTVQPTADT